MTLVADPNSLTTGYKLIVSPNKASGNTVDIYYIDATFNNAGAITDLSFQKISSISLSSSSVSCVAGSQDILAIGTTDPLTLSGNVTIYQLSSNTVIGTYYGNSTNDKYFGQLLYIDERTSSYMVIYAPSNSKNTLAKTYSYISMIRVLQNPNTNTYATSISQYAMN